MLEEQRVERFRRSVGHRAPVGGPIPVPRALREGAAEASGQATILTDAVVRRRYPNPAREDLGAGFGQDRAEALEAAGLSE
jgi:hypothetical protein